MLRILVRKYHSLVNRFKGYNYDKPASNGEYRLLKRVCKKPNAVIFDVGANVGDYAEKVLEFNSSAELHCFEPVTFTHSKLVKRIQPRWPNARVAFNKLGLSDSEATVDIHVYFDDAGINSLFYNEKYAGLFKQQLRKETITLSTIDDYMSSHQVNKIDLLKIDTEGNDSRCILGAKKSMLAGKIDAIQFEYNNFWKIPGYRLEETINLLLESNFEVYRLTLWGKVPIRKFSEALENYLSANYYAKLKS